MCVPLAFQQTTYGPIGTIEGPPFEGAHADFGYAIRSTEIGIFVGAPKFGDDEQGAVFQFDLDGQVVHRFDGDSQEGLGERFDVSGDWIALRRRGTVQVLHTHTMQQIGQAIPSNGNTVTLVGGTLLVSEEGASSQNGRVRILDYDSGVDAWIETATLDPTVSAGRFGHATAMSNDGMRLVVSAPNASFGDAEKCGVVVAYQRTDNGEWSYLGQIIIGDNANDNFGFSVALSGDGSTIVAGSPGSNGGGEFRGQVSTFRMELGLWTRVGGPYKGLTDRDRLGRALDCTYDGSRFVVSSYLHNGQRGLIRVFDLDSTTNEYTDIFQYTGESAKYRLGFGLTSVLITPSGHRVMAGATWAGGEESVSGRIEIYSEVLVPKVEDTMAPSSAPTVYPSFSPSVDGSMVPTVHPSFSPSVDGSMVPTVYPSASPSVDGLSEPTTSLTATEPTVNVPSAQPAPSSDTTSLRGVSPSNGQADSSGTSGYQAMALYGVAFILIGVVVNN